MRNRAAMLIVGLLMGWSKVQAAAVNQITGIDAPNGGVYAVKHFMVTGSAPLVGVVLKNNDPTTVFPRIAVLRGPITKLSDGTVLVELENASATTEHPHRVQVVFDPVAVEAEQDLYVAVEWPVSDGVVSFGHGAGVGSTHLDAPNGSFIASGAGMFDGIAADLAIDLIFQGGEKAISSGPIPSVDHPVLHDFLDGGQPNPFNPNTRIVFGLAKAAEVRLTVYDVAGRVMRRFGAEKLSAGRHESRWDGRDDRGRAVAAGIYLVHLQIGGKGFEKKIVLVN